MTISELRSKLVSAPDDKYAEYLSGLELHPDNVALGGRRYDRNRTKKETRGPTIDETFAWFRTQFGLERGESILISVGVAVF